VHLGLVEEPLSALGAKTSTGRRFAPEPNRPATKTEAASLNKSLERCQRADFRYIIPKIHSHKENYQLSLRWCKYSFITFWRLQSQGTNSKFDMNSQLLSFSLCKPAS
jgi:hypothetical protein